MRLFTGLAAGALLLAAGARAENAATNNVASSPLDQETNSWAFSASLYGYIVPDSRDYVSPIVTADRGWLHLEARYNYESLETGSLWVGYNLSVGKELVFDLTPMLGGVFGELTGIAPGYSLSLSYKGFALTSDGEYVFDTGNSAGSFFYTWSELSYSPVDWFRAGVVVQRTKAYKSDLDVQRGFLVGFTVKNFDFTTYVFNLGWTDPTIVLALGWSF